MRQKMVERISSSYPSALAAVVQPRQILTTACRALPAHRATLTQAWPQGVRLAPSTPRSLKLGEALDAPRLQAVASWHVGLQYSRYCTTATNRRAWLRSDLRRPRRLRREGSIPPAAFNTRRRKPAHASCSSHWTVVNI